jgi:hypothetical protein
VALEVTQGFHRGGRPALVLSSELPADAKFFFIRTRLERGLCRVREVGGSPESQALMGFGPRLRIVLSLLIGGSHAELLAQDPSLVTFSFFGRLVRFRVLSRRSLDILLER